MNIIILSPTTAIVGGVEQFSVTLSQLLTQRGFDVRLVTREDLNWVSKKLSNIFEKIGLGHIVLGYFLGRKAQQLGFDVCITAGLLAWNLKNQNIINVQHGTIIRGAYRDSNRGLKFFVKRFIWSPFEELAARRASVCVAVSKETQESIQYYFGISNVQVIQNAVDTNLFKPRNKQESRQKLGMPLDKNIVLFCGRLGAQKASQLVFNISQLLAKTDPHCYIVTTVHTVFFR